MHGIQPPKSKHENHVGPTWAFDLASMTFIPPTVQAARGEFEAGRYKADPMEGGGQGDQEAKSLFRHFSDFNVRKMLTYLERKVAVLRDGEYYKWDDRAGRYANKMERDGVHYPIAEDVQVISVMAAMTLADLDVNMVYPPIGPYRGNVIRTFDPRSEADRKAARKVFAPEGGCDFSLRVVQGGKESYYLLAATSTETRKPGSEAKTNVLGRFTTAAVNLRAEAGAVTRVELLDTPDADEHGLPNALRVLASWPK
jgi:hypothetical protein